MRLQQHIPQRTYRLRSGIARGLKGRGVGLRQSLGRARPDTREIELLRAQDLGARTVFDIGADLGYFTAFFADRVGAHGAVVSFEPNPASYERTLELIRTNGQTNVTVINVAVGDEDGHVTMTFGDEPGEGSADPGIREALRATGAARDVQVPLVRIDTAIADRGLRVPDFAKIDVEGFELQVLHGMAQTLERHRPRLFIELHGLGMEAKHANARQVVELLLAASYEIEHVESGRAIASVSDAPPEGHLLCRPVPASPR